VRLENQASCLQVCKGSLFDILSCAVVLGRKYGERFLEDMVAENKTLLLPGNELS